MRVGEMHGCENECSFMQNLHNRELSYVFFYQDTKYNSQILRYTEYFDSSFNWLLLKAHSILDIHSSAQSDITEKSNSLETTIFLVI